MTMVSINYKIINMLFC